MDNTTASEAEMKERQEKFTTSSREDILEQVRECVLTNREKDYGSPEDNFKLIADFWNTYINAKDFILTARLDEKDVAVMMALLKTARIATGEYKLDNYVDLAGYAVCAGEVASRCKTR